MTKYAKFLKEVLSNKRKLEEVLMVQLLEKSSTIIQRRLPKKLKDLGSFSISYFIGNLNVDSALDNLGANMDEDVDVPLILGRPFLATARAIIDVHDDKLILRVRDEQLTFQTLNDMKHPLALDYMDSSDDMIKYEIVNFISSIVAKDPIKLCLV
ncbi:uncharacterized protein LOC125370855 [Ricinus communis]|uniref:uncharacterized protein LOC125370855 n=1 Tax=Ricinus communis TaxID=3988 RepID=UPI00201A7461|nr:uncharacterized protein LOC125370855 [Ricinus communis]